MLRFAWDAVTGFSYFPLQIMVYVSAVLGLLAILAIPVIAILRLTRGEQFFGGQATTIVLLLLLSSFQLFFLFVLGQYVARIYDETRSRPLYIVASTQGLDQGNDRNIPPPDAPPYAVASTVGFDADTDNPSHQETE
jgi:dolichol-phosphate mannosyltransferase